MFACAFPEMIQYTRNMREAPMPLINPFKSRTSLCTGCTDVRHIYIFSSTGQGCTVRTAHAYIEAPPGIFQDCTQEGQGCTTHVHIIENNNTFRKVTVSALRMHAPDNKCDPRHFLIRELFSQLRYKTIYHLVDITSGIHVVMDYPYTVTMTYIVILLVIRSL